MYEQPYILLNLKGDMADGKEIWSCGIHLGNYTTEINPVIWFNSVKARIDELVNPTQLFIGRTESRVPAGVYLRSIKLSLVNADGKVTIAPLEVEAVAQGSSNAGYILQAALVQGLQSTKFRDPGKNNRFYLPTTTPTGERAYALTDLEQGAAVQSLQTYVEALNEALIDDDEQQLAVVSVISDSGTGFQIPVSKVRVGRVIDTQRRRRNSIDEDYVTLPVVD